MYAIHLDNVELHGYHGVYAEEQKTGGPFRLNLVCRFGHKGTITRLEDTVNYETVFAIVKEKFSIPHALLETLAAELVNALYDSFPFINEISVSIHKLNPPITGFRGSTGVSFTRQFPNAE